MLLVAAGLLVGSNVWAQTVETETINATLEHTASSFSEATAKVFTSTVDAEKEHFNNTNRNNAWAGCAYAEFSFAIPENKILTGAELVFTGVGSGKDRTTDVMCVNAGEKLDYSTETGLGKGDANIDLAATMVKAGLSFKANATADFTVDVTDAMKAIVSAGQKYIIFKFTNNAGGGDLMGKKSDKAPTLTLKTVDISQTTSYTVNFVDKAGNILKEAVVYTAQLIGENATASAKDMAAFKNEDSSKKYIYESGNETITLVKEASSNVINLVFREAEVWNYTVNAVSGEDILKEIVSGTAFEGDEFTQPIPRKLNIDGTIYTASIGTGSEASQKITMDADKKIIKVEMTATDATNAIYFSEAEEICTMIRNEAQYVQVRCSYKAGGYAPETAPIVTLSEGTYKITAAAYDNNTKFEFKVGEKVILTLGVSGWGETSSEAFTLEEATTLTVKGGNANYALDYVYITSDNGAVAGIPAKIGETGYATFSSTFALDLDDLGEDVTAYSASSVSGDYVVLAKAEGQVEAATGLILIGEAGTYNIPVATDGEAIEGNLLVGCTTATKLDSDANAYVLVANGDAAEFQSLATNGATIPAGHAYLNAPAAAARLSIVFEGETTGVAEVKKAEAENGAIYNLAGQRVAQPANGLYIVNGKKVIIK